MAVRELKELGLGINISGFYHYAVDKALKEYRTNPGQFKHDYARFYGCGSRNNKRM